jgi:surfactin synthase thioesterase subunit
MTGGTTLLCVPYAGAGAAFYHPWRASAPAGLQLVALQLPGREERIEEPPCGDVAAAVADLAGQLDALSGPVAVFGHSYGAVLGYELARLLAVKGVDVRHLFASGSPAPDAGRGTHTAHLSDDEFVDRIGEFAGYRHPAFEIPELREMLLPALRADVHAHEAYQHRWREPSPVPVTCLRGRDDHLVPPGYAAGWQRVTSRPVERLEFDGGHMYLTDHAPAVLAAIAARLLGVPAQR